MRITFDVPADGRDYLEWFEVEELSPGLYYVTDTNKNDRVDAMFRGGLLRNVVVGKPAEWRLPLHMAALTESLNLPPDSWQILGRGEPGFPDGFTVKSIA